MPAPDPSLFLSVDVFRGRWLVEGHNDSQVGSCTIIIIAREKWLALIVLHKNSSLLKKIYTVFSTYNPVHSLFSTPQTGKVLSLTTVKKRRGQLKKCNGPNRELPVLFWPKTDVPEHSSDRDCSWLYLIGQHPFSPVFCVNDRVLPIIATLLSFHPSLVILCSILVGYSNRPVRDIGIFDRRFSPM